MTYVEVAPCEDLNKAHPRPGTVAGHCVQSDIRNTSRPEIGLTYRHAGTT